MRRLRQRLGAALVEVSANLAVAGEQKRKQDLLELLHVLQLLQEASKLHAGLLCVLALEQLCSFCSCSGRLSLCMPANIASLSSAAGRT